MEPRPASALPSVRARVAAFAAILIAGVCGALIGRSIVTVGCRGNCASSRAAGTIIGALVAALGVAIVVVLVLRALGEWKVISADPGPPMPGGEDFVPD